MTTTVPLSNTVSAGLKTFTLAPDESKASYQVGETFLNQSNRFNLAVGVTQGMSGQIQLDPSNPQNAKIGAITIDISQFKSDSDRRDGMIRNNFLQSAQYPQAVFETTQIEGLPATYTAGQELTFQVTGNLKIRQATQPVTFDVKAKLDGTTLSGAATGGFLMSAFGFGPISIGGMLNTEDQVKMVFEFVAHAE